MYLKQIPILVGCMPSETINKISQSSIKNHVFSFMHQSQSISPTPTTFCCATWSGWSCPNRLQVYRAILQLTRSSPKKTVTLKLAKNRPAGVLVVELVILAWRSVLSLARLHDTKPWQDVVRQVYPVVTALPANSKHFYLDMQNMAIWSTVRGWSIPSIHNIQNRVNVRYR